MSWISGVRARLRGFLHRSESEARMEEEFAFHLAMETRRNVEAGMDPEEARRVALVDFGGVDRFREEVRSGRGLPWLESVGRDVRLALRGLRRSPGYALAAVLTLGLGIGATTAIFGAVHAVVLAPLPYPHSDRLVQVVMANSPTNRWGPSVVDFQALERQGRTFAAVGAVRARGVGVIVAGRPERLRAGQATSGFFRALAETPVRGRAIVPGDDRPGAPAVAVLSHELATRAFGDPDRAVGETLTVDGVAHEVVGVLAPGTVRLAGLRADVWPALQLRQPERRGPFGLLVIARMTDGATLSGVASDLAGISRRIFPTWAASFQDETARMEAVPLREAVLGDAGRGLWMFAIAVGLVLAIALANVASLTLVRAAGREREWALRGVLGASRLRLGRQILTEVVVLTSTGALAGLLLATVLLRILRVAGSGIPRLEAAHVDGVTFAFAASLALAAGAVVAAYPVVATLRREPAADLRSGDRQVGGGRRAGGARGVLVALEFALALPLLAGAALLLASFLKLQRVDPGFDASRVLSVSVALPSARYADAAQANAFWQRAVRRIREVAGVQAVGVTTTVPPDPAQNQNNFDLVSRPVPAGEAQPVVAWPSVSPGYFGALGLTLLDGRLLTESDSAAAPPVVVVSRAWERRFSPERSAVGLKLVSGGCTSCPLTTVVGVVGDVKFGGLDGSGVAVYEPLAQGAWRDGTVLVRTSGPPGPMATAVREAIGSVDPVLPLEAGTLDERVYASTARPRHWATLLGAFAGAALVLAAVGVFGLLSYLVATRRREIGVRVALGAAGGDIVGLVVSRGMALAGVGIAVGLVAAVAGARWLRSELYEVAPTDPAMLAGAALLLLSVALVACWLPARRAAAIDPMEVMRGE